MLTTVIIFVHTSKNKHYMLELGTARLSELILEPDPDRQFLWVRPKPETGLIEIPTFYNREVAPLAT